MQAQTQRRSDADTAPRIAINGRFLTQRMAGVQRFALETLKAIDGLLSHPDNAALRGRVELLVPPAYRGTPGLRAIETKSVGRWNGYAWEQLELPFLVSGKVLLGLCGLGPIMLRRQLVVMHDTTYLAIPTTFTPTVRFVYGVIVPALVRRAACLFAVSAFTREELARRLGADASRIGVCNEGGDHMETVVAEPGILARNGLVGRRYFLAVGVGGPNKNHAVLLEAFGRGGFEDMLLVLTGKRNTRVHTGTGIEDREDVHYVGYVSDGELRALYENAVALVYPSSYEGFGLPPLEAMVCGCVAIVADQPALVEVAGDAGVHFPYDDPGALAELMRRVSSDETFRREMAARARARATAFRWENTARTLLDACLRM
jgi:glycosyltransferase involved in cell wall biosynthesis